MHTQLSDFARLLRSTPHFHDIDADLSPVGTILEAANRTNMAMRLPLHHRYLRKQRPKEASYDHVTQLALGLLTAYAYATGAKQVIVRLAHDGQFNLTGEALGQRHGSVRGTPGRIALGQPGDGHFHAGSDAHGGETRKNSARTNVWTALENIGRDRDHPVWRRTNPAAAAPHGAHGLPIDNRHRAHRDAGDMRYIRAIAVLILADIIASDSGYAIPMVNAIWIADRWLPFRNAT